MENWCTIESDPGVFTELIENLGVSGVEVEEIFSLSDREYLQSLKPIYGLIFLFRWSKQLPKREVQLEHDPSLFFARQAVTNACATQAILSVLLNRADQITLPVSLQELKDFCVHLDPYSRGLAIGESEGIRKAHNAFARPEPVQRIQDPKAPSSKEDLFHFVAYIPHNGCLYELDGLQEGPLVVAEGVSNGTEANNSGEDWLEKASKIIEERMQAVAEGGIKFSLLAVKGSTGFSLSKQRNEIDGFIAGLLESTKGELDEGQLISMLHFQLEENVVPVFPETLQGNSPAEKMQKLLQQRDRLTYELGDYEVRRKAQKEENERRQHNYLGLIFELFKLAAENGQLEEFYEQAIKK